MPNPYESLFKKDEPARIEVSGWMECTVCYEGVEHGLYDRGKKELSYTCSKGHVTVMGYEYE